MQGALRVCAGSGCQGAGEGVAAARRARGIGALGSPGAGGRGASGSYEDAGAGGGAGLRIGEVGAEVGASAWAWRGSGRTVEWRWGAGDPHFRAQEAAGEPAMVPTRSLL